DVGPSPCHGDVERGEGQAATAPAVIPVAARPDVAGGRPRVGRGGPHPAGPAGDPLTGRPGVAARAVLPRSRHPGAARLGWCARGFDPGSGRPGQVGHRLGGAGGVWSISGAGSRSPGAVANASWTGPDGRGRASWDRTDGLQRSRARTAAAGKEGFIVPGPPRREPWNACECLLSYSLPSPL